MPGPASRTRAGFVGSRRRAPTSRARCGLSKPSRGIRQRSQLDNASAGGADRNRRTTRRVRARSHRQLESVGKAEVRGDGRQVAQAAQDAQHDRVLQWGLKQAREHAKDNLPHGEEHFTVVRGRVAADERA